MSARFREFSVSSSLRTVAVAVVVGALAACHGEPPAARDEGAAAVTAVTEELALTDVPDLYEVVGTVRSRTVSVLSSRLVGRVLSVRVEEGTAVRKGQVLVEIDAAEARAALRKAEAGLGVAGATHERYRRLLARRSVSRQEFDEVEARYRAAEADVAAAQAAVAYAEIASPIDGVITAKQVEVGSLAAPGVPLLTVEDAASYRLETLVHESRLDAVREARRVAVTIDALGDRDLEAHVAEIVPAADPRSRTFVVRLELPGTSGLRSGMFGRARFPAGSTRAVTLPIEAVVERGSLLFVYTVDAHDTARLQLVRLGRREDGRVIVLSGLEPGERVVVGGVDRVRDGARLAPAGAEAGAER